MGKDDGAATTAVQGGGAHVLLLPAPGMQGHANPMLQLGRRLAFHGLRPTLVVSRYVLSTTAFAQALALDTEARTTRPVRWAVALIGLALSGIVAYMFGLKLFVS